MRKAIILNVFILCSLNTFASWFGWSEETPHGNHINDESGKCLNMRNGVKVNCLNEWYFYDNCVIGRMDTAYDCHTYKYFVAHEMFNTVDTFYTEQDWKAFIKLHHLEPFIWKRTYSGDWRQINLVFFFILFSYGLPIYILYRLFKTAISIEIEQFNLRKPLRIITIIFVGLFLYRYLLDVFPGSI